MKVVRSVKLASGSADGRLKKAESTRQRILDVATDLFLNDGFALTSLDKVAESAETTKPTVYSHFKSKQGLFDAVIQQHARPRVELLQKLLIPSEDPEKDLIEFGDQFMSIVLSEDSQRWDRLAAAESINNPEVGEAFYKTGPAKLLQRLNTYLRKQTQAKRLFVLHPERAAEQLVGLLLGVDLMRIQIGQKPPSVVMLRKKCREAVSVFLAAYGGENE